MTYSPPRAQNAAGHQSANKKKNPLFKEAKRDVMLSYAPQRRAYRRARRQVKQEARQGSAQIQDIYGQLGGLLGGINAQYGQQTAGIAPGLTGALSQLGGVFNQSIGAAPQSELSAGMGLTGMTGAAGLGQLASMQARNAAYGASAQREGVENQATLLKNQLIDRQNAMGDIRQQRLDMFATVPQEIRQRMDDLERMEFDKKMAIEQMRLSGSSNALSWASYNSAEDQRNIDNAAYQAWVASHGNG